MAKEIRGTLYKVTGAHGESIYGGNFAYDLPKGKKPGKWAHFNGTPVTCESGFHLVDWQNIDTWLSENCRIWKAEYKSLHGDDLDEVHYKLDGKIAVSHVRLLEEVQTPQWFLDLVDFGKRLRSAKFLSFDGILPERCQVISSATADRYTEFYDCDNLPRSFLDDRGARIRSNTVRIYANDVIMPFVNIAYPDQVSTRSLRNEIVFYALSNIAFADARAFTSDPYMLKATAETKETAKRRMEVWLAGYIPIGVNGDGLMEVYNLS